MKSLIRLFLSSFLVLAHINFAFAQTAALLPNAVQQYFDSNGNPLSSGKVYTYIPGTLTFKTTWQDADKVTPNTNPITLDAGGKAIVYGDGTYRQIVKDRNLNTIWDGVTYAAGVASAGLVGDGNLVGTVLPWSGLVAPNQYLFAYGQEVSRSTYSVLFTAITQTSTVSCTSGSPTLSNISDTTQIPIGAPVESNCLAPGATVLSKTVSTVTTTANSSVSITSTAIFFPWGNGDGSATFNIPDYRGRTLAGRDNMGGTAASRLTTTFFANASAIGATGGVQSKTLLLANLPTTTLTGTTNTLHTHFTVKSGTISNNNLSVTSAVADQRNVGTASDYTLRGDSPTTADVGLTSSAGSTTNAVSVPLGGSATAISLVQPTITINYIIKVLSDTSTSEATGVASLGGMTGTITCGFGLTCTSNSIAALVTGGTVTSVECGTGLTGGTILLAGTCAFDYTQSPTWTGVHTFSTTADFGIPVTLTSSNASANQGPQLFLDRASASPAANDVLGGILFGGRNTLNAYWTVATFYSKIITATSGAEDGAFIFQTTRGGSTLDKLTIGAGVFTPNATSGDKGIDTINASEYFENGISKKLLFKNLSGDVSGANSNTAQPWFPTAGAVTLAANKTYRIKGLLYLSRAAGANSHTTTVSFGGTANVTSILVDALVNSGDTAANENVNRTIINATAGAVVKAASTSTTEQISIEITGTVRVTTGGTLIPQFLYSAAPGGAPTVKANSFFELNEIGTDAVVSVGTWG